MFVHPSQVADIARRHTEIKKARLVVTGEMANDIMTLHCEVEHLTAQAELASAIVNSIRDVTKLRGEVQLVAIGSLPNDGKVIADDRSYQ
jgi:phenylacetate-CoA ligase